MKSQPSWLSQPLLKSPDRINELSFAPESSPLDLTTYSHELFTTAFNHELSLIPKAIIKGKSSDVTSCPDANLNKYPTFSPTVVPIRYSTEGLEVNLDLTCTATLPPSLVSPPLVVTLVDNGLLLSPSSLESTSPRRDFITRSFVSLNLPLDDNRLLFLRKGYCLLPVMQSTIRQPSLLTALSLLSKQPSSPPSPPFLAWRGWERSVLLTRRLTPPRKILPSADFSLSAYERPRPQPPAQPFSSNSRPLRVRTHRPLNPKKLKWIPRSAARRRLEQRRNLTPMPCTESHPSVHMRKDKKITTDEAGDTSQGYSGSRNKPRTKKLNSQEIFSYVSENLTHVGYLFYWEAKAG